MVEVHRVTVKKGEVFIPISTLFLTFNQPEITAADPSKTAPSKVDSRHGSPARRLLLQGVRTIVMNGASVRID